MKQEDKEHRGTSASPVAPLKRRVSRLAVFIIVAILIGAAFGAGALLVNSRFQAAQETWRQEKAGLDAKIAAQLGELSTVRSRDILTKLVEGMSQVYVDVSEKNFGLAREKLDALSGTLAKASEDLDAATKAQLAPLPPLIQEIGRAMAALSPESKAKAREAMDLLNKMIETNGR